MRLRYCCAALWGSISRTEKVANRLNSRDAIADFCIERSPTFEAGSVLTQQHSRALLR